jgi:SAM-dependent MidA family methyltransferase
MTARAALTMLPTLPPDLQRHCEQVCLAVQQAIAAAGGWLSFDDYLRIVQYAPGLGYYSAGSEKFGVAGDFVTAPEISGLFARCVARQCAQVLQHTGGDMLELGAGSGALAAGVLGALHELNQLPQHYFILEVSADLRARQQQRLAGLPSALRARVQWLDALPATPTVSVLLTNEVADALPCKRFVIRSGAIFERGVALGGEPLGERGLLQSDRPADAQLRAEVERMTGASAGGAAPEWSDEYVSELCLMTHPWILAQADVLARGMILLIDYGCSRRDYYHPQRTGGTLRCHFRHRAHDDALLYPGLQDISAWVDFTRIAEAASEANLQVSGYCTQTAFLLATGIEQDLAGITPALEHAKQAAQARKLLLPGEMGENFKVMALTRDLDLPLRGFAYQDLRGSL